MKFELRGDLDKIEETLKEFIKIAHEEYERVRPEQQEKVRKITLFGKSPELPDDIVMAYVRHDEYISFGTMSALPSSVERLFKRRMERNLREFLKKMGCDDVEVKWVKT